MTLSELLANNIMDFLMKLEMEVHSLGSNYWGLSNFEKTSPKDFHIEKSVDILKDKIKEKHNEIEDWLNEIK